MEPPASLACSLTAPIAVQPRSVLAARADLSSQEEAVWPVLSPTAPLVWDLPPTVQPV